MDKPDDRKVVSELLRGNSLITRDLKLWLRHLYYMKYSVEILHHARQHGNEAEVVKFLRDSKAYFEGAEEAEGAAAEEAEGAAAEEEAVSGNLPLGNIWKFLTELVYNNNTRKFFGADEMLRLGLCDGIGSMRFVTSISEVFDVATPLSRNVLQKDNK